MKIGKKLLLVTLIFLIIIAGGCGSGPTKPANNGSNPSVSDELDLAIRDTSNYLNDNIPKMSMIVILNIQSDSTALSDYVIDELIANAVNDKKFKVVDRRQLDLLRAEQNFQLSGEVDDSLAISIGKFFGAQTIISGKISKLGERYRMTIRALDVQTAQVQGQYNRNIASGKTITELIRSGDSNREIQSVVTGTTGSNSSGNSRVVSTVTDVPINTNMRSNNRPLQDSDFEVAQTGNILTITKYKASGILNVVIPQKVFSQNLSIIGSEAFKNCGLQSVVIPDTVTEIGYGAFANNNLEKVTLGKGLKIIKGGLSQGSVEVSELGAFEGNKNLTEIVIPDTVTEIGARAFKDCGLKRAIFGELVNIIGESAFRNNQLPDILLQPATRYIRRFAFHQNQLKNILIPNGILEIHDEAFTNNPLESVVIPASLATLTTINNLSCPRIGGYNAKYTTSAPRTFPNTLVLVTFPANLHDDNLATFEESLKSYYVSNRKAAGVYVKTGRVWNYRR